ncbi:MAG: hypothetical protein IPH86_13370 [bacterium]|nr:hypothetical protein [bacterium]
MKTTVKARKNLLSALALSTALLAGGAQAADATASTVRDTSHRGFFLGLNAGGGGSQMMFKDGSRHITEEPLAGGLGQLRVGYDLSRHFAVGVESIGFTSKKDDNDWELGAVLATVTWRPCDKGFFLRAGVGVGGGDFTDPTRRRALGQAARGGPVRPGLRVEAGRTLRAGPGCGRLRLRRRRRDRVRGR